MSDDSIAILASNAAYLAELYQLYQTDRSLVDSAWADFFDQSEYGKESTGMHPQTTSTTLEVGSANATAEKVVEAFRRYGHLQANLSPLAVGGVSHRQCEELTRAAYSEPGQTLSDFTFAGATVRSIDELFRLARNVYCGTIGFEYSHITSADERQWLQGRIEGRIAADGVPSVDKQREIFTHLLCGDLLEAELHKKYVGAKRFSLEGNDTLMPLLNDVIERCAQTGVGEVIFGMAHRGRLNVLVNTLGKPLEVLFSEFEDTTLASVIGAGDVKYHLGFENTYSSEGFEVRMSLAPNPSHLEFVNPVIEGIARAKQDSFPGRDRRRVLAVAMHGDAAVAGQGIVFETLNFSNVEGYTTGGTLHIVINNQIGFTTTPDESRSTRYCTDLAKGLDIPVFHVNAEDPEAACWVARLAVDYRNEFGKDVFIDLIGHRKHGHNEGDDPTFTQPLTYSEVKGKIPIWQQYSNVLRARGTVDDTFVRESENRFRAHFSSAQSRVRPGAEGPASSLYGKLVGAPVATRVSADVLKQIADELVAYPKGFVPHPKLAKIIEKRSEAVHAGEAVEWGVAEALAFGSLVLDGVSARLSGQDCRRGTFSHRHLILDDFEKTGVWSPLESLGERTDRAGRFEVYNSTLSEAAVLGFEFGYSATARAALVVWEAQFGDFANGAQVIIDQFVASSETKWGQLSGVTLLLPHGFEGQGPEHSSARLERYLQLCAEGNMSVCYPTTAAQHFHLLRRQGLQTIKRPLVVMTPKSLLRLPAAMSPLSDFTEMDFQTVIAEGMHSSHPADTLIILSGKVYYDVHNALKGAESSRAVVCRLEELYPFPAKALSDIFARSKPSSVVWVQEEPHNQGAWSYVAPLIQQTLGIEPRYVGRAAAAATATGSGKHHNLEQQGIIQELLALVKR